MSGYPSIELYIDGRWKRADGQPVLNPAVETVLGTIRTKDTPRDIVRSSRRR